MKMKIQKSHKTQREQQFKSTFDEFKSHLLQICCFNWKLIFLIYPPSCCSKTQITFFILKNKLLSNIKAVIFCITKCVWWTLALNFSCSYLKEGHLCGTGTPFMPNKKCIKRLICGGKIIYSGRVSYTSNTILSLVYV